MVTVVVMRFGGVFWLVMFVRFSFSAGVLLWFGSMRVWLDLFVV